MLYSSVITLESNIVSIMDSSTTERKGDVILVYLWQNYKQWSLRTQVILMSKGNWAIIEGKVKSEATANELDKANVDALMTLQRYFGGEVEVLLRQELSVQDQLCARKVWEGLQKIFTLRSGRMKASIAIQFFEWSCSGNLAQSLKEFDQLLVKCQEVDLGLDEYLYANKLLSGLPNTDVYRSFKTVCHAKGDALTLSDVRDFVRSQLTEDATMESSNKTESGLAALPVAPVQCYGCGERGHMSWACPRNPNPTSGPPNRKKKNGRGGPAGGLASAPGGDPDLHQLVKALTVKVDALANKSRFNYSASDVVLPSKDFALFTSDLRKNGRAANDWVCDSGSGEHMCNNRHHFVSFTSECDKAVKVADDTIIPAAGIGTVVLFNREGKPYVLRDVLYVPKLCCHLFSIRRAQEGGLTFTFPGNSNYGTGTDFSGTQVLRATLKGKLFILDLGRHQRLCHKLPSPTPPPVLALHTDVIWHQRLGHVAHSRLPDIQEYFKAQELKMDKDTSITTDPPCFGCSKTKIRRRNKKTFRIHNAKEILEVTHTDLLTMPEGLFRYRYIITFLDEKSHHARVYCMERKSEAFDKFKIYKAEVENERKSTIGMLELDETTRNQLLRLQSDNGGEYTTTVFQKYLDKHGIQHYCTNADEPRQNGMSERYGQTLYNMAMAMLTHSKLPIKYWPYALNTACRIINCLPTKVLSGKSPHEEWYGERPDVRNLRIFGCDAWVRIPDTQKRKGKAKAKLCTFLGYRFGLKGYIFEDKVTKRIIKSGDAIFYEGNWITNGIHHIDDGSTPPSEFWTFDSSLKTRVDDVIPPPSVEAQVLPLSFVNDSDSDSEIDERPRQAASISTSVPLEGSSPVVPDDASGRFSLNSFHEAPDNLSVPLDHDDSTHCNVDVDPDVDPTPSDENPATPNVDPVTPPATCVDETTVSPGDDPVINELKDVLKMPTQKYDDHDDVPGLVDIDSDSDSDSDSDAEGLQSPLQIGNAYTRKLVPMATDPVSFNLVPKPIDPVSPKSSPMPRRNPSRLVRRKRKYVDDLSPRTVKRIRANHAAFIATCIDDIYTQQYVQSDSFLGSSDAQAVRQSIIEAYIVEHDHNLTIHDVKIPMTKKAALSSEHAKYWEYAMADEILSIEENETWGPPVIPPEGTNIVGSKWVFSLKPDGKTTRIKRFKARFIAKGYSQKQDVDYTKTFAPVLQPALLRALLALSAAEDWEIEQVDIKTAFLYGELEEDVYIRIHDGTIRKLDKALYGLKQAGRQWNGRFHKSLVAYGFERIMGDGCCYIKICPSGQPMILQIHVDDCVICGSDMATITHFKDFLRSEYKITDLGAIQHCLGWEIARNRSLRTLSISQQQYIRSMVIRFDCLDAASVVTPAQSNLILCKAMSPVTPNASLRTRYMELLGSLLYSASSTRPDIAYAVSELSKFASNPGLDHWNALIRVLLYLKGTDNFGLIYGAGGKNIYGFMDASYARCPDSRKSRSGGLLLLNNAAVDWRSKMQTVIALSSMESEYIASCELVRLACWLRSCLSEIGFPQTSPTPLGIDNRSAKIFAEDWITQSKSKHIDIRYHYVRQQIVEHAITLLYTPTNDMPADALTKPLDPTAFKKFRSMMGVRPVDTVV